MKRLKIQAGALNQALAQILPGLSDSDRELCVDADTELAATNWIERAQANEYARYAREITRTRRTMSAP